MKALQIVPVLADDNDRLAQVKRFAQMIAASNERRCHASPPHQPTPNALSRRYNVRSLNPNCRASSRRVPSNCASDSRSA